MSAVATIERDEPRPVMAVTPAQMLQVAAERGADLATLERFMDLNDRWEASQAKKAYVAALTAFKSDPPKVVKDLENKQFGSRYTSLANLVNTVNAALGRHGLNAGWDIEQPDGKVKVTCTLTHAMGHSESVSMIAPPDTSGGNSKNPIQQIKSTITYLEAATFQAITGIVAGAACDDDGNAAGEGEEYDRWLQAIESADVAALSDIGNELAKAQMPAQAKSKLRAAFTARRNALGVKSK